MDNIELAARMMGMDFFLSSSCTSASGHLLAPVVNRGCDYDLDLSTI